MKYLWIVMLAVSYIVWTIAAVKNIYNEITLGLWKFPYCLDYTEWYSKLFILYHIGAAFLYSLALYFKWW